MNSKIRAAAVVKDDAAFAEPLNLPRRAAPPEWHDLDWQRKAAPEHRYTFGMVDQDHELLGRCGDNFFLQQGAASALD